MAKFDLFNPETWGRIVEQEAKINNKGIGTMGQKIPDIRDIRADLAKDLLSSHEYELATWLKDSNPKAFELMGVVINYNSDHGGVAEHLIHCDKILDTWKRANTQDKKFLVWQDLIPHFKALEMFMPNGRYESRAKSLVDKLRRRIGVQVSGNEAWEMYRAAKLNDAVSRERFNDLTNRLQRIKDIAEREFVESYHEQDDEESDDSDDEEEGSADSSDEV